MLFKTKWSSRIGHYGFSYREANRRFHRPDQGDAGRGEKIRTRKYLERRSYLGPRYCFLHRWIRDKFEHAFVADLQPRKESGSPSEIFTMYSKLVKWLYKIRFVWLITIFQSFGWTPSALWGMNTSSSCWSSIYRRTIEYKNIDPYFQPYNPSRIELLKKWSPFWTNSTAESITRRSTRCPTWRLPSMKTSGFVHRLLGNDIFG